MTAILLGWCSENQAMWVKWQAVAVLMISGFQGSCKTLISQVSRFQSRLIDKFGLRMFLHDHLYEYTSSLTFIVIILSGESVAPKFSRRLSPKSF